MSVSTNKNWHLTDVRSELQLETSSSWDGADRSSPSAAVHTEICSLRSAPSQVWRTESCSHLLWGSSQVHPGDRSQRITSDWSRLHLIRFTAALWRSIQDFLKMYLWPSKENWCSFSVFASCFYKCLKMHKMMEDKNSEKMIKMKSVYD